MLLIFNNVHKRIKGKIYKVYKIIKLNCDEITSDQLLSLQSPQFNRGGGTVCVNLPELWTNYRDSVNDVEPCPRKKYFLRDSMDE